MLHLMTDNSFMFEHISSGNLINDSGFLHPKRTLDHFVILVGKKGTMHLTQNNVRYHLEPNGYLLLFPDTEHHGHLPSDGEVAYHWCHFRVRSSYKLLDEEDMNQAMFMLLNDSNSQSLRNVYIIPEVGNISAVERTHIIFRQLIDLAKRDSYSPHIVDCALSLLGMEITQNYIDEKTSVIKKDISQNQYKMASIMEYVRINAQTDLSVTQLADIFNYNADYLSTTFRKTTGYPLLKYINSIRISKSQHMLLDTQLSVKEIAGLCGFLDEKHFMKLFKQFAEVTPTQYRNAYFQTKMNKN